MFNSWLQELKPGDRVAVEHNYDKISIYPVERVTATTICVAGMRFRRTNGYQVGGDCDRAMLRAVTPQYEEIALRQLARRRLNQLLNNATIEKMPIDKVRAIAQLLED